jgi:hypothetical protein
MSCSTRHKLCLVAACAVAALPLASCGATGATDGFGRGIDKARAASALSSIQQAMTTASLVAAESGAGTPAEFSAELQSRDPSNRYTTATPTEAGVVQVMGSSPLMLVAVNGASNSATPPQYVAVWQASGAVLYYRGEQPPAYSAAQPAAAGWSTTPPA